MTESKRQKITDEYLEEAARLKTLWNARPQRTQAEFGERYGLGGQANVGHYLLGRSSLNAKAVAALSTKLGIPASEFSPRVAAALRKMTSGIPVPAALAPVGVPISSWDEPPDSYVRLPVMCDAPAGPERFPQLEKVRPVDVLESYIRKKLNASPGSLKVSEELPLREVPGRLHIQGRVLGVWFLRSVT